MSGVSGIAKGALTGSNPYTLPISGFTVGGNVNVTVAKSGYTISGTPRVVSIYYVAVTTDVTFNSVTANGSASQTTTALTLNFSAPITGLSVEDISLSGVSGVVKGALTGSNPYTLAISGFNASGTLTVTVTKTLFNISGTPKTVSIFYVAPVTVVTPANLASHLASLSANTASTPHTIKLYVTSTSEFSTIKSALDGASNKYVNLDFTGSTITTIPNDAFYGTLSPYGCATLTGVTILNGVTSIGNYAFGNCVNLTSVIIPSGVTSIGESAFRQCTNLTSITLPDGVTSIGLNAFLRTSIANITIPDSVTVIGAGAFNYTKLVSVTISSNVTSIGNRAFTCDSLTTINISPSNNAYSSENGVLYNKSKTSLHTYPSGKSGTSFIIPSSVTSIMDHAFIECTSLVSVTIPNGVTSIEEYAFYGCKNITSVTIPNTVNSLGMMAFFCIGLTSVEFKGTIPSSGFYNILTGYLPFPGDLRAKFYATDSTNGTPGLYTTTNPGTNPTWTPQP